MADAKVHKWQDHANHFQAVLEDMQAIIDDPTTTPEEKQLAAQVLAAVQPSLSNLNARYGIVPGEPKAEQLPAEPKTGKSESKK